MTIRKSYVFSNFKLEPDVRRLSSGSAEIHLTKKPFEVLIYLIEHRDRLVTRRELLDTFWEGHEVYEESLTKCVGAIRKALNDPTDNPRFVLTQWAEGYRFIGELIDAAPAASPSREAEAPHSADMTVKTDNESAARIRTTAPVQDAARPNSVGASKITLGLVALATVFVLAYGTYLLSRTEGPPSARPHSLAVLPLANLTGNDSDTYLSDGITENLINSLSRDPDMAVVAPGSSFAARDRGFDVMGAAEALAVENLVTGSLQKDGDILRVAVRLVEGKSGRVLWTKEFVRSELELFALQDEIARSSMEAISGKQTAPSTPIEYGTRDVEAYILYLKGRHLWHSQTEESLAKAIALFEQAITRDQNFVLAYCGLSDAYNSLGFYYRPPNEVMPKAEEYASKALALDPNSADANFSSASVTYIYRRDLPGTDKAIRQVIELSPRYALAHNLYGDYLMSVGRVEEGLNEVRWAAELDPLVHFSNCDLGWQYFNAQRFDRAIVQSRSSLESSPSCPFDRLWIGQSLAAIGKYDEALAELKRIDEYSQPEWVPGLAERAYVYAISGRREKARRVLDELEHMSADRYVDPYCLAVIMSGLGDGDATFEWLEKALAANSYNLVFLRLDQRFEKLHTDRRYSDLIKRAGLE